MTEWIKYWVLIVDDQPNWRSLLADLLSEEFNVFATDSYSTALDALQNHAPPFHVLVTDLRLDDRDRADESGLELVAAIGRMEYPARAIVVTGYPTIETANKAYRNLSAFHYLEKYPGGRKAFNHDQFRKTVREAALEAEGQRKMFTFVLMPFAEEYQAIYEDVVKETVEVAGLSCLRADNFYEARRIMEDIRRGIREATYLIADLSGRNPNVFYEVGIAHAEGKLPILLTQNMDDVPSRLKDLRCIAYKSNVAGAERLRVDLLRAIQSLRQNNFVTPPLFKPFIAPFDPRFCFVLLPLGESSDIVYKHIIEKAVEGIDLTCLNAQQLFSIRHVTDDIWQKINQAKVIIADLSGRDPDVFYLTGICHGLDKDVILLAREANDIPFDLRDRSHIIYSIEDYKKGRAAHDKLKQILTQILNEKHPNSITNDSLSNVPTIDGSGNADELQQQAQKRSTDRTELRQKLETEFSIEELRTLCFDLGVDHENIPGLTKEAMTRELVLYCERHNHTSDLLELCRHLRPNGEW